VINSILKKYIILIVCLAFFALTLIACGSIEVTWLDADGNLLYMEEFPKNEEIPQRELPVDSDEWHYINWRQVVSTEKSVTYIADRIANQKVTWKDATGTILQVKNIPVGEMIPERVLPYDTEKWHYTTWLETRVNNEYTYVAERELKADYFVGNVFQIVAKDLAGEPVGTGTGFVFDKTGWFITNAHVMEEAYQAIGIFEIKNSETNESFTTLEIKNASYVHHDKDIFIGKLEGYSKIETNYKDIPFQSNHSVGDITYSVGYPNSSVSMEIHKGEIKKDLSSLYDKLYSGISYIASDSFLAPGSSGGILVNENAEVIGLTTLGLFDDNGNFELGAAIEAYNYINLTSAVKDSELQDMTFLLHPNETTFIKFFRDFITQSNTKKIVHDDLVYYQNKLVKEERTSDAVDCTVEYSLYVLANGFILYHSNIYWEGGAHREEKLYGTYSNQNGIDNFSYDFKYTFDDGEWYTLKSDDINYSENLNLTLRNYTKSSSYNVTISNYFIEYAKGKFNYMYEWLYEKMEAYK